MAEPPAFHLEWLPEVLAAVRQAGEEAIQSGTWREFADTIKVLNERLRSDPLDVGEIYRSRGPVEENSTPFRTG
jgi:hypothetical protein